MGRSETFTDNLRLSTRSSLNPGETVMNRYSHFYLPMMLIIALSPLLAQTELVRLEDIEPEEIAVAGFQLDMEQELQIEAIGAHRRFRRHSVSNARIAPVRD